MTIIELYINSRLCDTGNDFSVRLNRQLLKPDELNNKDAQYSYSITLPPTLNNNRIFNYSNIEETSDKFNREYKAELIIDGIRIFNGNFRLSEVNTNKYKGNLYVSTPKSIKDIFGELKLNEHDKWRIDFYNFAEDISKYNRNAAKSPQKAIFPYVLYGVLPKVMSDIPPSPRDVWDDSVMLSIESFPPSINTMLMLKHIFNSKGYKLGGSAFSDERLTRIYMSYKNAADYVQPWNYGTRGLMKLKGLWYNTLLVMGNHEKDFRRVEYKEGQACYTSDLFYSANANIEKVYDIGNNITIQKNDEWNKCQINIPVTGYYKITLKADISITPAEWAINDNGINYIGGNGYAGGELNCFKNLNYEVKILRDRGTGNFDLENCGINKQYSKNNLNQDTERCKYFPNPLNETEVLFIDPAENPNFVIGAAWGGTPNPVINGFASSNIGTAMSAKTGYSWNTNILESSKVGMPCPGYKMLNDNVLTDSDRFRQDFVNGPDNRVVRGRYNYEPADNRWNGSGDITAIVWLERGESLTLVSTSEEGTSRDGLSRESNGWVAHSILFEISLEPFQVDSAWLKVDDSGNGIKTMNWNDKITFDLDSIDLVKFLPANVKTDDFIDNFCKTFNLRLSLIDPTTFNLDVKQPKVVTSNHYIDLDNQASLLDRSNIPLELPSLYKLGFTVNPEEEGYVMTGDDGGGEYPTGTKEEKIVEQKSNFSYNWFKSIIKKEPKRDVTLPLPIISAHEVWTNELTHRDAMKKSYTDSPIRFWYYDGLLNDLGGTFSFEGCPIDVAKVSNGIPNLSILNYRNSKYTILDNYFTVLINAGSHYTEIESYLTPEQYERVNGSNMVMFNRDLYYVAEISGYDPTGRNKTKCKLIRKI